MTKTLIIFGSTLGNSERVAQQLAQALEGCVDVFPVNSVKLDSLASYDRIILGTSTWGEGKLQDDWVAVAPKLARQNLFGKQVAIFGLGDASSYPNTFVDAMAELHASVAETGAQRVGYWSSEGYAFNASRALEGDRFVGLVLDEDNQADLTEERLHCWVECLQES